MDISLFQFSAAELPNPLGDAHAIAPRRASAGAQPADRIAREFVSRPAANSANLDFLRAFAVLVVVAFHLAKFFNVRLEAVRVTDFGLLGVMLFFVHTTLVLMFSLERQTAGRAASLFFPFMIRRAFRIYPLAVLVVACAYVFRIPSDLQFGGFHLFHQSAGNLIANLLLIQNVTLQKANPGVLWSLPLELQMYLALPALFLLASRARSGWAPIALWWVVVGLWFAAGRAGGVLPLSEGGIRSPVEALLKYTRFAPCFLPGIVAYKLWHRPRALPAALWPVFLLLCAAAFVLFSGRQPIETGWLLCFAIGLCVCLFHELRESALSRAAKQIARYSYGIYLLHYFAIWLAFVACRTWNAALRTVVFIAALVSLSVFLYHAVEAPLIAAGVRVSERFKSRARSLALSSPCAEAATQVATRVQPSSPPLC